MAVYVALKHWAGNVSGCTDLVARHFYDDVVSFMHPHSPASLSLGGEAHMLPLFSVETDKEDADTHWLGGTVQLGATAPLDIAFDINQDEVDDNLAEHISMDSEFPSDDDARRVFVVRFSRHEDGGADCDYMRIDVPLEDACALVGKEEAATLRTDSERHALERQRLEAEMIGAARGARRVARRAAGGLKKGAKKAGRAGKKKVKKAGGAIKRKAKGAGRVVKRKAKKAYAGSKKLATKGRERAKSAYRRARTSNSRATASKGLGEIASKGKAKQAALKQQREKPLPATPKQKAPSKPVGKKPAAPGTQKQAAQKAAAKKTAAKSKAKDGKKKAAAAKKPADKPAAKGGGLGLPGAGSPGGGAGEAPGGGGEPAGGGGEGFGGGGGGPMGPVVLPGASPDEVPPRAAFISVVPRPVPDEGALVEPASVFDDPYADEDQFLEDQDLEYDEDFVENEIGDELDDDYDDDEDEDDEDEDDEWLGDEMASHAEKWARIVSPSDRWQYVQGHLEALAWSESCNEPHVYVADIAAALAS